jgi:butyrate kinase
MQQKEIQQVELTVMNIPGVLGQVVSQIRREGWNIKRLFVDETENAAVSDMQIDIEGTNAKIVHIVDRLLQLDRVIRVRVLQDGVLVLQKDKSAAELIVETEETEHVPSAPQKLSGTFRILTINPGSTSTKFAVYDNEMPILVHTVRHDGQTLAEIGAILEQKNLCKESILSILSAANVPLESIDAIAGRGGLLKPIESGTYLINNTMLQDLHTATAAIHASALGAIIASEIANEVGVPAYVVDPIVVDEMDRHAKLTGLPGIERSSVFHALNQKAIAKRLATELNAPYENLRFVVAHLGGGITIGAHQYGRVIDVNDALAGEGPFTPERTGNLPIVPIIKMCFSGEYTEAEMIDRITKNGGMQAYLGTNDVRKVQKMISEGDDFAALVLDSMAYQVSKEIGAMVAVLEGEADAIILTGGLAYSNRFTGSIKQRVDKLAPVHVFPGEDEMLALMEGVLRVLQGKETPAVYE